jgi:hypothetical protein
MDGDWWIYQLSEEWANVGPGYARYEFWVVAEPDEGPVYAGTVYNYWHAGWPDRGMHEDEPHGPFIWLDFIDISFPP